MSWGISKICGKKINDEGALLFMTRGGGIDPQGH